MRYKSCAAASRLSDSFIKDLRTLFRNVAQYPGNVSNFALTSMLISSGSTTMRKCLSLRTKILSLGLTSRNVCSSMLTLLPAVFQTSHKNKLSSEFRANVKINQGRV